MLSLIRGKFGPIAIAGIIGFIAFVFVFSGIYSRSRLKGVHESAVAGEVNGEAITLPEFNRDLNRKMEMFKAMAGGKLTDEQIKMFRLRESVFSEIVNRRLMRQEAEHIGVVASDEEVKSQIRDMAVFQKDGKFDKNTYVAVLAANRYSPSSFEKAIREDLSLQAWNRYFRSRVKVADDEIKREYEVSRDKRDIKYVLLTSESAAKALKVEQKEIDAYLADEAKLNLVKGQFEAKKETTYKGKTFDQVKGELAKSIIAASKYDEIKKLNEKVAAEVAPLLSASKGSDAKVNALLKPFGVEVKLTGLVNRQAAYLPGVGEAPELVADAFAKKSPIDPTQGGKAKVYHSAIWSMVAVIAGTEKADPGKLPEVREDLAGQIVARKERDLMESWMKGLQSKAKIARNEAVLNDEAAQAPLPTDGGY